MDHILQILSKEVVLVGTPDGGFYGLRSSLFDFTPEVGDYIIKVKTDKGDLYQKFIGDTSHLEYKIRKSNEKEKIEVFEILINTLPAIGYNAVSVNFITVKQVMAFAKGTIIKEHFEDYAKLNMVKEIQLFENVIAHFYGYVRKDKESHIKAFELLALELMNHLEELNKRMTDDEFIKYRLKLKKKFDFDIKIFE